MRTGLVLLTTAVVLVVDCPLAMGQEWDNNGGGDIYCDPNLPPQSVTVGDGSTVNLSTLNVRGDHLPVTHAFNGAFLSTFRTDVPNGNNQSWSMVRGQLEIGTLYHGNPGNAFQIKAMQSDGSLWLRNSSDNGFRIHYDGTFTLNTFPGDHIGFASLGSQTGMNAFSVAAPWSRLHLAHEDPGANLPEFAFRPWQRNGVTLTGMSDFGYFGQKYYMGTDGVSAEEDDNTDVVIAVGDEDLEEADANTFNNISFRFLGANGVDGSAGTIEGLEMMRLRPYRATSNDPIISYTGIGDWVNNAAMPEESLDVLEGKVRIRSLPTDAVSTSDELVTVNMTNGNLEHRPANALPDNCEWSMNGTSPNHVYTAVGTASGSCPDEVENVGIGIVTPAYKLHVVDNTPVSSATRGIHVDANGGTGSNTGIFIVADSDAGTESAGLIARANNGTTSVTAISGTG